ncbi:MAG: hypothetical protein N2Z70_04425 [Bdellovibrionaceae bacterium]|jgi:hypothetical protein|nr:hypothetical protein [Pseudobdellovibrionaceae bacterium]
MSILVSASFREYFQKTLDQAEEVLKKNMLPAIRDYLIDVLEFHSDTRNAFPSHEVTLAEAWLRAQNSEEVQEKMERLKLLGDRSLYISGYFGDSLQRKLVDIDYYAQMGALAFEELAILTRVETHSHVYSVLSKRFMDWVEILAYVASQSDLNSNTGVLRLYERYLKTGSDMAYQQLVERGVVTLPKEALKKSRQDE